MTSENEKVHLEELGYGFLIKYDGLRDQNRWTAIGPLGRIGGDVPNRDEAAALISMERTRLLGWVTWHGQTECPVPDVVVQVQRKDGRNSVGRYGRNVAGWKWSPGHEWNVERFRVVLWPERKPDEHGILECERTIEDFRERLADQREREQVAKDRDFEATASVNPWPVGFGHFPVKPEEATAGDECRRPLDREWASFEGAWSPDPRMEYRRKQRDPLELLHPDKKDAVLLTEMTRIKVVALMNISNEMVKMRVQWDGSANWLAQVVIDTFEVRHDPVYMPIDWWQALKERWIPERVRKLLGIQIRYRKFTARTVMPDFTPPRHWRTINRMTVDVEERLSRDPKPEDDQSGSHSE